MHNLEQKQQQQQLYMFVYENSTTTKKRKKSNWYYTYNQLNMSVIQFRTVLSEFRSATQKSCTGLGSPARDCTATKARIMTTKPLAAIVFFFFFLVHLSGINMSC